MDLPLPIPSGAPPASTSTPPPLGGDWQSVAYAQINKPYIWGSAGGRSDFSAGAAGFDCSGYVSYVMKNGLGIDLPAFTGSAYQKTSAVSAAEARPGDVVFYNMDSSDPHQQHIAIYIGDGKIIQAGGVANTVNVASVNAVGTPEFRRPTGAGAGPSQQLVGGAGAFAAHNLGVTSEGLRQYGPDAPGETLTAAQRQTIQRLSAQGGQYNASGAYGPDAQDSSPLPDTLTEAQRQTIARLQAQQQAQPGNPVGDFFSGVGSTVRGAADGLAAQVQSPDTGNPVLDAAGTTFSALGTGVKTAAGAVRDITPTSELARGATGMEQLVAENRGLLDQQQELVRAYADAIQRGDVDTMQAIARQMNAVQAKLTPVNRDTLHAAADRNPSTPLIEGGANLAGAAIAAPLAGEAMPAIAKGIAAAVDPATGLPALAGHAGEAAMDAARASRTPAEASADFASGGLGRLIPQDAPETDRFYNGSASAKAPAARRYRDDGLYGPGYYLTSDPRVAGGNVDEAGRIATSGGYANARAKGDGIWSSDNRWLANDAADLYQKIEQTKAELATSYDLRISAPLRQRAEQRLADYEQAAQGLTAGPNVRPVDVPRNLNLLDADAPVPPPVLARLAGEIDLHGALDVPTGADLPEVTGRQLWRRLKAVYAGGDTNGATEANATLASLGYDGIRYAGGRLMPMADSAGNAIEHTALVVFPESLHKLTNGISGTAGGFAAARLATTLGGGAAGGLAGYNADPNADQPTRLRNAALGVAGGAALGAAVPTALGRAFPEEVAYASTQAANAVQSTAERAGNILLPKYIPAPVQDVIRAAYDANPDVMEAARRGVVPDTVVKSLADEAGTTVQKVIARWKPGQAQNAETLLAMRGALDTAGQKVVEAQAALRANPASADALNGLAEALTTHLGIQEAVTGVTAEAGRALRQFRQPVTGTQFAIRQVQRIAAATKMPPEELATQLAKIDLSDPAKVANLARTLQTHTFTDKLSSLWYFNLLSSPVTHIRNTVSNSITAITAPLEGVGAAAIDAARSALTGAQRERYLGEVPERYFGMRAGLSDGWTSALQVWRQGFTDAQAAGQLSGSGAAREPFQGLAGKIINTPGRALAAEDQFFRAINKTADIYAQAYRMAKQEGLTGDALARRITELRASPTAEMLKHADGEGAYRVFQQDGQFVQWASQMPGPMRFLVPFVRTPYNIAKYALERSPAGALGIGIDLAKGNLFKQGVGNVEDRVARVAMGSTILAGLLAYAADGNLTGATPQDANERDAFTRTKQPYSIRVGDNWYSYQALQPYSTLFAAAGAIHDAQQKGQTKEATEAGTLIAFSIAKSLTDMPWTQGLTNALDAWKDPQKAAGAYAEQQAGNVVPGAAFWRFVARAVDNTVRDPKNPVEAMLAGLPGLEAGVPARYDAFGKDVTRDPQQAGLGALNPFSPKQVQNDPVEKALADLQITGWSVQPGFVDKTQALYGQQVPLSNDQQRRKQQAQGSLAYALLLPTVTQPGWDQLPADVRSRIVTSLLDTARATAAKYLEPELQQTALEGLVRQQQSGVRRPAPRQP
jgi:hypothetical protein